MKSFVIFNEEMKLYYIHQFSSEKSINVICKELKNSVSLEDAFFEELINSTYEVDFLFKDVSKNKNVRAEILKRKYEAENFKLCGSTHFITKTCKSERLYIDEDKEPRRQFQLMSRFDSGDVFIQILGWTILIVITFGLATPFFIYYMLKFIINSIEIVES